MKEYRGYSTLLVVALLFVMPLLFAPTLVTTSGTNGDSTTIQLDADFVYSDTDTSRVEWQLNQYENEGFERWVDTHRPSDVSTYRTTEHFTGFSTDNFTEGIRSCVLQTRAIDPDHPSTADLRPNTWFEPTTLWSNLTISFDWIVDSLPISTDGDYYRLRLELGNPGTRYLTYYLGCDVTGVTNSTYNGYYMIDAAPSGWNTFDRNITADFENMTGGSIPTQFEYIRFELYGESGDYSRIYMDDLNVINSTNIVISGGTNNGNFEDISYWTRWSSDPADISQSTFHVEGDYSLNATALSYGNQSKGSVTSYPDKRLSALNQDSLKFQWYIDDFSKATDDTYAYLRVGGYNDTDSFSIYYPLCYGGYEFPETYDGYTYINASGFNTTGQWNQFDRSIWNDITTYNSTSFFVVDEIEIEVNSMEVDARISILVDDISFTCASLNDMGYEDQGTIGSEAWAWDLSSSPPTEFSITDVAYRGGKAGNVTVADSNSFSAGQDVGYIPVTNETDLWLDLWWRLEDYTGFTDDSAYIEVSCDNGDHFAYVFANGSAVDTGNGFDDYIILPENGTEGTWFNLQRNIHDDYVTLFGTEPSTFIYQLYLEVETNASGRVSLLFDDVYLYIDPEPGIENLYQTPSNIEADVDVEITVDVIDASLDTVTFYYSVDSGPWITQIMSVKSGDTFNASIPGQDYLSQIQYYVSANDTFGNSIDSAVDLGLIYGYDVVDTTDPNVSINSPEHDATVGGTVSITVDASDAGSDISYVEIWIEEDLVANLTSSPYLFSWDTTSLANGTYTITAKAFDGAGNSGQVAHNVLVQNAVTPTTTTPTTPDGGDITLLLIAVAVSAVVIVVIVLYFLQKKGKVT